MIEIIFDRNPGNAFGQKEYPVFEINGNIPDEWNNYMLLAEQIFEAYKSEKIIIIRNNADTQIQNWLAVALCIQSCLRETMLEAAVFKVEDDQSALEAYKPFVALTIGTKYAIRLAGEEARKAYKDIAGLSYLGIKIIEDYQADKLFITSDGGERKINLSASSFEEGLIAIGITKSLVLAQFPVSVKTEILCAEKKTAPDTEKVISRIIEYFKHQLN